ncbi:MAG: ROK family protein [Thermoplasmata archaeon]
MKAVIDIGGTKTFIGTTDGYDIFEFISFKTPKRLSEFLEIFEKVNTLSKFSDTLNIAIPGRADSDGWITFLPNVNLKNFNIIDPFRKYFNSINVQNDVFCGALNLIYKEKARNSLLINWGSGIGGAIIINGAIYTGNGNAGEIGHISFGKKDIEKYIGGLFLKDNYGYTGYEFHTMAENGDKKALENFKKIGAKFGYFLRSMIYILDPDSIYLFGSFLNSWPFMEESVKRILETYDRKVRISIIKDKYYVLKGCYFLDDFLKNKKSEHFS